ncbi:DUF4838 domain-containing protein [Paenibacillus eucommiae]|uniref:SLH domain-containing protein n=1 Tax=Paenibacillus eucommiae TaxID=1355755 RepID=A0ABS4J0G2_9BACL|nr:DUF4838 domain-containing protein [Paenibacillus eucommiae]MBP1993298.1 hypothetical protein [Paenibacillus eucommiae]
MLTVMKQRTKKSMLFILIFGLLFSMVPFGGYDIGKTAYASSTLIDIGDSYAKNEIMKLVDSGMLDGYDDGTFAPAKSLTRGEMAKVISSLLNLQPFPSYASHFIDVPKDSWYQGYVGALVKSGITSGTSDTTFSPDDMVKREELVTFFIRAFELEKAALEANLTTSFSDAADISKWALPYVSFAQRIGLLQGIENNDGTVRFAPKAFVERQAMARIAYEFLVNSDQYLNVAKKFMEEIHGEGRPEDKKDDKQDKKDDKKEDSKDDKSIGSPAIPYVPGPPSNTKQARIIHFQVLSTGSSSINLGFDIQNVRKAVVEQSTDNGQNWTKSKVAAILPGDTTVHIYGLTEATSYSFRLVITGLDLQVVYSQTLPAVTIEDDNLPLPVATGSEANAIIVIETGASEDIRYAAETLVEYVQKSTGAALPILTEAELQGDLDHANTSTLIYIGIDDTLTPSERSDLQEMDRDGFMIVPRYNSITILGPSVWGTLNGVYDFIERYIGVRWLMFGEVGEDVPQLDALMIPKQIVKEEPAFMYRIISPLAGRPVVDGEPRLGNVWAQRNRLQGQYNAPIQFNENLSNILPFDKYGKEHPEFYPQGKRPASDVGWQPCFTAEGIVDVTVEAVLDYFRKNPTASSISLGVNDSAGYCEEKEDHPHYPGKLNSIGVVDMSDIYFEWANEVVEKVLLVYPDKWFGLLAYQNVMDPPSFEINARIIPFVTQDRMSWMDESIRDKSHAQMDEWRNVANQVAWYDYAYGTLYVMPRIYNATMASYLQYGYDHEVIGQYTEMYQNIGDGPKGWVSAKLQWDPEQDVELLLSEWYERAVGPEAAADLAAFYDHWEHFWTVRIQEAEWFTKWADRYETYLDFTDASYLDIVTEEDISKSKQLLASVVQKAQTPEQIERAKLIQRFFEYYEAVAISYPRNIGELTGEDEVLAILDQIEHTFDHRLYYAERRHELVEEFSHDPNLQLPILPRLADWDGWNANELWQLAKYLRQYEPEGGAVTQRVNQLAQTDGPYLRQFTLLLQEMHVGLFPLTRNPSFEEGSGTALHWSGWEHSLKRVENPTSPNHFSLQVEGGNNVIRGGVHQTFNIKPGLLTAEVIYFAPLETENGSINITMNLQDASGATLDTIVTTQPQLFDSRGKWSKLQYLGEIPEVINGKTVAQAQMIIVFQNLKARDLVYLDDVYVYQPRENLITKDNFWELTDYIQQHEASGGPLYNQVLQLAEMSEESVQQDYAKLMLEILNGSSSLTQNSSFETEGDIAPWSAWIDPSRGETAVRTTEVKHSGNASLKASGIDRGGPYQFVNVSEGLFAARAYYYLPSQFSSNGTINIYINLLDDESNTLQTVISTVQNLTPGDWYPVRMLEEIPDEINGSAVVKAQMIVTITALGENTDLYLDDLNFYQIIASP